VGAHALFSTIGGGQLEFLATDIARSRLSQGQPPERRSVPLGPAIGQCCGGHVTLRFETLDSDVLGRVREALRVADAALPHVYIFGAGHVGRALAYALSRLPVALHVVETRAAELRDLPDAALKRLTALPETIIEDAPAGSAFVVTTHEHALDFLLTSAALARHDAAYVGMIGSATKRASFEAQWRRDGGDAETCAHLACPIGTKLADKRPAVIAALAASEIIVALSAWATTSKPT
jgi:xanthine dehydrogenase accessory factor